MTVSTDDAGEDAMTQVSVLPPEEVDEDIPETEPEPGGDEPPVDIEEVEEDVAEGPVPGLPDEEEGPDVLTAASRPPGRGGGYCLTTSPSPTPRRRRPG